MPLKSKRVLVFGDSNMAAVRHAQEADLLVALKGCELEYWGAAGPEFRHIHFGKGGLLPIKPKAEEMVLKVNGNGRKKIGPNDFDLFIFYGVRLRLAEFFAPYLSLFADKDQAISEAALRRAADTFLNDRRSVRMAAKLRKAGAARIVFAYAGFPVWGVVDQAAEGRILSQFPAVSKADKAARMRIWKALEAGFEARGLELLRQPEDMITKGMFTSAEFAVEGAHEKEDASHKSAGYAAKLLNSLKL